MGKRYNETVEVERVPAGGGYDEWFDVRDWASLATAIEFSRVTGTLERSAVVLTALIADWSLTGADGQKLPVTAQTVSRLKGELIEPLWPYVKKVTDSFLALASAIKSGM